ncbi:hypothetical protein K32_30770 [Kaistia sp. 32K]|uniref:DUF2336 domain-containing protein n=1 Tax=Kaistia sp. 32K TaxID=2795690 RepID=UPI0019164A23|nr:DUF2336 domain-containing protein [Kaistia sp. 32K]BCP54460.1 hypothetical protein K32_30770 [Kaistia sp. 32K]
MDDHLIEPHADAPPGRKAELLASITDLFGNAGNTVSPPTAALYAEIVLGVFDGLASEERLEVAERIALLPNAPAAVLSHLAGGAIETAEPVLRHSIAFDDTLLVTLAETLPRDRLGAIAGRLWVSEAVSDALLDRGDRAILKLLARNPGARFSQHGLTILVEEAEQTLAARRAGTGPAPEAGEWGQLLEFPADAALVASRRAPASSGMAEVIPLPVASRRAAGAPVTTDASTSPVASVIATVASGDRMLEVAGLLAAFAGLPVDMVRRMIAKPDTMPLAVLCKAAGVTVETFAAIAAIRGRRHGQASETVETLVRAYEALGDEDVERALRFLRARHGTAVLSDLAVMQNPAS